MYVTFLNLPNDTHLSLRIIIFCMFKRESNPVCFGGKSYYRPTKFCMIYLMLSYLLNDTNACTKANRTLDFLRHNLSSCPQDVKETAYKGLVRPVLEYASPVWDPHRIVVQEE